MRVKLNEIKRDSRREKNVYLEGELVIFLSSGSEELLARAFFHESSGRGKVGERAQVNFHRIMLLRRGRNTGRRVGNFVINEISRWTRSRDR